MEIAIEPIAEPAEPEVEIVERKGLGHPDSICDALAERVEPRPLAPLPGAPRRDPASQRRQGAAGGRRRRAALRGRTRARADRDLPGRARDQRRGRRRRAGCRARRSAARGPGCGRTCAESTWSDMSSCIRWCGAARRSWWISSGRAGLRSPTTPRSAWALRRSRASRRSCWASNSTSRREPCASAFPALGEDVKVMGMRRSARFRLTVAAALVDRHLRGRRRPIARRAPAWPRRRARRRARSATPRSRWR